MTDHTGRDPNTDAPIAVLDCEQWEALLVDRMDQTAGQQEADAAAWPAADQAAFAEHARRCPGCGDLLEQAQRGREWLRVLGERSPAPPAELLSKILAQTHAAGMGADFPIGSAAAAGVPGALTHNRWGIPLLAAPALSAGVLANQRAHRARVVMTAAMAFFSVALTLSLAGVKLTSVHAAELRPQVMQANVTRSFYGTKKQVVSFYENLRLVYEVESKMKDLRREAEPAPTKPAQPSAGPAKAAPASPAKVKSGGAAQLHGQGLGTTSRRAQSRPPTELRGWPESAAFGSLGIEPDPAGRLLRSARVWQEGALIKRRNRI